MMNNYGTAAQARPDGPSTSMTELDGLIAEIRSTVGIVHEMSSAIYRRVMPPTPALGNKDAPTPIATTYADKLIEVRNLLNGISALVSDLSAKI